MSRWYDYDDNFDNFSEETEPMQSIDVAEVDTLRLNGGTTDKRRNVLTNQVFQHQVSLRSNSLAEREYTQVQGRIFSVVPARLRTINPPPSTFSGNPCRDALHGLFMATNAFYQARPRLDMPAEIRQVLAKMFTAYQCLAKDMPTVLSAAVHAISASTAAIDPGVQEALRTALTVLRN